MEAGTWMSTLVLAGLLTGSPLAQDAPGPALAPTPASPDHRPGMQVTWKNGLRFSSDNGSFAMSIGGRIQNDWSWISGDESLEASVGDLDDGTEFRRARLYAAGIIHDRILFKGEYDFTGGSAKFKDMWIGMKGLPAGAHLKVGHFKEPFGMEFLTSGNHITFMERGLPDAFTPKRNNGFMLQGTITEDDRLTWAAGLFRDSDKFGTSSGDGGYDVTTRITGLPWYEKSGAHLLHIGGAYSHRSGGDSTRIRQRPEAHLSPYFVDTMAVPSTREDLIGAELALVYDAFSLQGEFMVEFLDPAASGDATLTGWYAYASWFATGEHRSYKKRTGAWKRLVPLNSFSDDGWGALELSARLSAIDLDDGGVAGGELNDVTLGANWYLTPNTRIMMNYVHAELQGVGNADALSLRFQVDF